MAAVKVKLNNTSFRRLRTDPQVQAEIMRRAQAVAAAAGEGFDAEQSPARNRARAAVIAVTPEARAKNARDHTLLRALEVGR